MASNGPVTSSSSSSWPGSVHREHHKEVTSTQLVVKDMLKNADSINVEDMYCVSADVQTTGKGRGNHHWESPVGCAMQSILLFVKESQVRRVPGLTQVMAVSVANAIDSFMSSRKSASKTQLKWPNDIIIQGKKVGGILAEVVAGSKNGKMPVVIGVGVNVDVGDQVLGDLKRARWPAGNLKSCEGVEWKTELTVAALRNAILDQFLINAKQWMCAPNGCYVPPAVSMQVIGRQVMVGEKVRVSVGDGKIITGVHSGMDEHGYLIVTLDNGKREVVMTGEFLYGDSVPVEDD
ncbi:hypothetical protein FOZ61_008740 [Perkinsus olseni]|uniref:BPL/LPL catalytic domain-containing protein n=1 Tax=Perkinsus olseni TaxID=32597 RepID=A0A7J6KX26_PEROL|nr:hypothetical protein FOL46_010002 [Perkinsus olseni]KAF4653724.1 hypothetical protein FOZ61_008740 [Perkinsus olseni]